MIDNEAHISNRFIRDLAGEFEVDLIDLDPTSLSLSERIRQRRQRDQFANNPTQAQIDVISMMRSQTPPAPDQALENPTAFLPADPSVDQEPETNLPIFEEEFFSSPDVLSVESEEHPTPEPVPQPEVTLTQGEIVIYTETEIPKKLVKSTPLKVKNRPKPSPTGKKRGENLIDAPDPELIAQGYKELIHCVPPEDYHAIQQSMRYADLVIRDTNGRLLVHPDSLPELLARRNSRESGISLTSDYFLLHTFGNTPKEKAALQSAAKDGRLRAIRKKDGWYVTREDITAFLEARKIPDGWRPLSDTEYLRYRDHITSGRLTAKKIKNQWYSNDALIGEFESNYPSTRRTYTPSF